MHETEWQFASSPVEECWTGLKLTAIGVISCRGELYVFEFEWQFVSSPVEESWVCVEIVSDWCDLLWRRVGCV